ncbi:SufS family cysteine desulfurase [Streptomyces uncialis]|uniref:SufS family cysteine desulfurase n=1 Tax=Streptomyces uncialis TaxID=1048205 RepID=UPI002E35DA0A|nr:SufS family cysteine desulfurase [Streptomyces uncialis]
MNSADPSCSCAAHRAVSVAPLAASVEGVLDAAAVRGDFPILRRTVNGGMPLVYLDSAATSQKPQSVLDAETDYYRLHNANVHRSHHELAREATALLESARIRIAAFVGGRAEDIVVTKNASEALNLVAYSLMNASHAPRALRSHALGPGDSVVITEMEHHSNLMPWQQLCRHTGAELRWLSITAEGRLDLDGLEKTVDSSTRVLAFTHQSNVYGTINPVPALVRRAREVGALTVLDACQSVPHMPVDVSGLGVDFLAFSGHKMCGPTGIGVLWGRSGLLGELPPFLTGGDMNESVSMTGAEYAEPPHRFEAGTPVIAQTIGLAAACSYLDGLGRARLASHHERLTARALDQLSGVRGVRIVGPADAADRGPAVSFAVRDLGPDAVGEHLDRRGIAIRVGHLCARPACVRFGLPATTRASFYAYNTDSDVDVFTEALAELSEPRSVAPGAASAVAAAPPRDPVAAVAPGDRPDTTRREPAPTRDGDAAAFMDTVFADAATAATGLAVSLGDRLGLYRAMAGAGPLTPAELAARSRTQELYIREWLHTQAGSGYVRTVADGSGPLRYELPPAHAEVLADSGAPTAAVGIFAALQSLYGVEDRLAECFRTGGGVDWGEYPPQMFRAVARFFRPAYRANIVQHWIPAVEGLPERLTAGACVADIGCGVGYSTLLMSRAYPRSVFHGYDPHRESVERARVIAEEQELDDRTHFHTLAAADLDAERPRADLVTFFNCLHDMGDPVAALRGARRILKPDAVLLLVEPNAEPDPTTNTHPTGMLFMALSAALCLPAAAAQNGPAALGNHAGEAALRAVAGQAGFTAWKRVAETPRSAVYAAGL